MATGNIAQNDITGRFIKTDPPNQAYRDGWDKIFNKNKKEEVSEKTQEEEECKQDK